MASSAGVRGYLFADLRGYTRLTEAEGDHAAARVLGRYLQLVRATLAEHAGAELRTEGDGVYAVFPSPSAAVEAAMSLVAGAAVPADGGTRLPVAVGIHAGEAVDNAGSLVGSAVNIAARICAKAEAGEVLVSGTVRNLTRTLVPFRFVDLGAAHLKGVAERVPLYRVETGAASRGALLRRKARARRRGIVATLLLAVLTSAGIAAAWAAQRPPDCVTVPRDARHAVIRVDGQRGCATRIVATPRQPRSVIAAGAGIWIASIDDWILARVDASGAVTRTIGVPGRPEALAAAPTGDVYVLLRDDRTTGTPSDPPPMVALVSHGDETLREVRELPRGRESPAGPDAQFAFGWSDLEFWGERAWLTNAASGQLARVRLAGADSSVNIFEIERPVSTPSGASRPTIDAIAATDGALWLARPTEPSLYRVSSDGVAIAAPLDAAGGSPAIAATRSAVWLLRPAARLTRFDPFTMRARTFEVGGQPSSIAATDRFVWLLDRRARNVRRFDTETEGVDLSVNVGGIPADFAVLDDDVWVTLGAP